MTRLSVVDESDACGHFGDEDRKRVIFCDVRIAVSRKILDREIVRWVRNGLSMVPRASEISSKSEGSGFSSEMGRGRKSREGVGKNPAFP